jgi:hypothetical protein
VFENPTKCQPPALTVAFFDIDRQPPSPDPFPGASQWELRVAECREENMKQTVASFATVAAAALLSYATPALTDRLQPPAPACQ